MYRIKSVSVDGFWGSHKISSDFQDSVNIVIGRNGTGKTTFMEILRSVLSVDVEAIDDLDFTSAEIILRDGSKTKKITATKKYLDNISTGFVEYKISNKKYSARLARLDASRYPISIRNRFLEEIQNIRGELSDIVKISSLSVYRTKREDDFEVIDRKTKKIISPVDYRLEELLSRLTRYQLELSQQARKIGSELQKEVLASLLYTKADMQNQIQFSLEFNKEVEKRKLSSAYKQLGVLDSRIQRKIIEHVDYVDRFMNALKGSSLESKSSLPSFVQLESIARVSKIVELSIKAEEETKIVYSPISKLLEIAKKFIQDKKIEIIDGALIIEGKDQIALSKLSSGEKQLLILLIEALLQCEQEYVFLADEPELSLHIAWQRQIIPAIQELNPKAQIIVATHSPEIAGGFADTIIDMEDMFRVES